MASWVEAHRSRASQSRVQLNRRIGVDRSHCHPSVYSPQLRRFDIRFERREEEEKERLRRPRREEEERRHGREEAEGGIGKEGKEEENKIQILTLERLEARKEEREAKKALRSSGPNTQSVTAQNLLRDLPGGASESTETTRKLEKLGDVARREIPRARSNTLLGEAARVGRNDMKEPTGINMAPLAERSEYRSPSGTNSHTFNSLPSTIYFQFLSHVPCGIG